MRFYSAAEVHAALPLPMLADAIARTLSAGANDGVNAPLRHAHSLSTTDSLLLMPAWSNQLLGVKLVTTMSGNQFRGDRVQGNHPHSRHSVNAVYVVFDRASGAPSAVIDGEALTLRRTAAASLLAARYLARPDALNILVIGTGQLAPFMAHAHCAERAVARLWLWGRDRNAAQSLAQRLRDEGLPAIACEDLASTARNAELISCATTATSPLVHGTWLSSGTHLDMVGAFRRGMREVDDAAVARARIFVDTYAGALAEAADLLEPIERGVINRSAVVAELAELVTGAVPGRASRDEITMFKSVGTALEDLAAAGLLLERSQS